MKADPVLILSTGRCGSTMISNMLARHPKILSLSEFFVPLGAAAFARKTPSGPQLWTMLNRQTPALHMMLKDGIVVDEGLYRFDSPGARFAPGNIPPIMCVTLPHLTEEHEALYDELEALVKTHPRRPLAEQYRSLFETLAKKYRREVWIERSGGSLMLAATLLKLFPDAKIVHVFRDGRDTALSMSQHHNFRLLLALIRKMKSLGIDVPKSWIKPDIGPLRLWLETLLLRFLDVERMKGQQFPLADYGKLWNEMILAGCSVLQAVPRDRLLAVRFEDVQQDPRGRLSELIRFIHPEFEDSGWLDEACGMLRPARSKYGDLPESERIALTAACEPGLTLLGYPL
jgi:hypothetical protein